MAQFGCVSADFPNIINLLTSLLLEVYWELIKVLGEVFIIVDKIGVPERDDIANKVFCVLILAQEILQFTNGEVVFFIIRVTCLN